MTSYASFIPWEDLATQAGAGPLLVKYLKLRQLDHVATFALIADDVAGLQQHDPAAGRRLQARDR